MKCIIQYFQEEYQLYLSFNYPSILGKNIFGMKAALKAKLYELILYKPENEKKIIEMLETETNPDKRQKFIYFMNLTYKEIYKRYLTGDINFPIFKGGTLRIPYFITLKKKLEQFKEELIKNNENELSIKIKLKKYETIAKTMIEDIESGKKERNAKKGKKKSKRYLRLLNPLNFWKF